MRTRPAAASAFVFLMLSTAEVDPAEEPGSGNPTQAPSGAAAPPEGSDWKFTLAPYFWITSIDADVAAGNLSDSVDLSFSDVMSNADAWGLAARFEAWRKRLGFYLDGNIMVVEAGFDATGGPISIETDVDFSLGMVDFGAGFRVLEITPLSLLSLTIDAFGGGRYAYLDMEVSATGLGPLGISRDIGDINDWVEPVLGARVVLGVTKWIDILVRGDIGGYSIGSAPDLSWNVLGGVGVHPISHLTLLMGYRVFGLDYEHGSGADTVGFDGVIHGPVIGLALSM